MHFATHEVPSGPHWNYLLALDSDLVTLSRYVDFCEHNFECYSIEIVRILLAAAAEVDVVCKQLCQKVEPTSVADSIGGYRKELTRAFPEIPKIVVSIPRYGLNLQPWQSWEDTAGDENPQWWTAYNKVKHHRHTHYDRANLENGLNAVAGLFVIVLHLYEEQACLGRLKPSPQLLRLAERDRGMSVDGGIAYNLGAV